MGILTGLSDFCCLAVGMQFVQCGVAKSNRKTNGWLLVNITILTGP